MYRIAILTAAAGFALFSSSGADAKFRTLYNFTGGLDGSTPLASLLKDSHGNLYGTAFGGAHHRGVVFKISQDGTQTVMHAFAGGSDGAYPASNLIQDRDGNLYGTTTEGGGKGCGKRGCGTVFELAPDGTETILHAFQGGKRDGANPFWGVIIDRDGNLYGTAMNGFGKGCRTNQGCGIVFELQPDGTENVLYAFKDGTDAANPDSNLIRDQAGNLYGAALWGGSENRDGAIFEIAPNGTETLLYIATPETIAPAGLALDADGNFYTTVQGGEHGHGAVLKLAPDGISSFAYSFLGGEDGDTPLSGVIVDGAGNLYGTTIQGGGSGCAGNLGCGTVFEIASDGAETILHSFNDSDGSFPNGLLIDRSGKLYGTTQNGGTHGDGTAFRISP